MTLKSLLHVSLSQERVKIAASRTWQGHKQYQSSNAAVTTKIHLITQSVDRATIFRHVRSNCSWLHSFKDTGVSSSSRACRSFQDQGPQQNTLDLPASDLTEGKFEPKPCVIVVMTVLQREKLLS